MSAPAAWLQTGSNRAFDLMNPRAADVDFDVDIAESLARISRFTGHIRAGAYSVAQHCVMGADVAFRDTGHITLAAAFLLHDAHEAYLGDIATPIAHALAATADAEFERSGGYPASHIVSSAIKTLKLNIDRVIYQAAGLEFPLRSVEHAMVKALDLAMLATERRILLGPSPKAWGEPHDSTSPIRLCEKLNVWPWPKAADEYRERLRRYGVIRDAFPAPNPARPRARPRAATPSRPERRAPCPTASRPMR